MWHRNEFARNNHRSSISSPTDALVIRLKKNMKMYITIYIKTAVLM